MAISRRELLSGFCALTALLFERQAAAQATTFMRIGTASTAGTYFPIGGIIASAISNPPGSRPCDRGGSCGVPGLIAVVQSTEGSVHNVEAIAAGLLESGFSQADVAYWAFHGEGVFEGREPMSNLRAIANLYPELIQIVVTRDSGIRSVADLAGRRISLDREGSGTLVDATLVLEGWNLTADDLDAYYISANSAVDLMRRGALDGLFLVAGTPTPSIADLAREVPISIVPVAGPEAEALRARYPFFAPATLQSGVYHSVGSTRTLSVGAQWLIAAEIDEELVHAITAALWHPNTRQLLNAGHPKGRLISIDTALNGLGVPLHPGALRYYEELGISVIESVSGD